MSVPLNYMDLELYNDRVLSIDDAVKKLLPGQRKILFMGADEGMVLADNILDEVREIMDEGVACARTGQVFDVGVVDQPDFVNEVTAYNAGELRLPYKSCIISRSVAIPNNSNVGILPEGAKSFPTRWLYVTHETVDRCIAVAVFGTVAARPTNAVVLGPMGVIKPMPDDQFSFVFPPGMPETFAEHVFKEALISVLVCLYRLAKGGASTPVLGVKVKPRYGKAFKVRYTVVTPIRSPAPHTHAVQHPAMHASPAGHMRRGHWRSLKDKSIWVRDTAVKGGPVAGQVRLHYKV